MWLLYLMFYALTVPILIKLIFMSMTRENQIGFMRWLAEWKDSMQSELDEIEKRIHGYSKR